MYSKEETQKLKHEFWIAFAQKYPRKWVLYDTKIKDFSFKFYVNTTKIQVLIDIEPKDTEKRLAYFEKMVSLQNILEEEFVKNLIFNKIFTLENGKIISRIWVEKSNININNRNNWETIFDFFNKEMNALELFYLEYDEYIKDI